VDGIKDKDSLPEVIELNAMLLNNLTSSEKGCARLLGVGTPLVGLHVNKLIETFVFKERTEGKDPYSWIALALMNITQLREGRELVLNKDRAIFPLLLPFVKDANLNRRRGILGVIRYDKIILEILLVYREESLHFLETVVLIWKEYHGLLKRQNLFQLCFIHYEEQKRFQQKICKICITLYTILRLNQAKKENKMLSASSPF
jgi:hypothetical protein